MLRPFPSSPLHILVVDDDPAVCEALTAALAPPYVVHSAATSAEAAALAVAQPLAAVILDAVLGDEDGVALVPQLRQRSSVPILLLTGHGSEALAVRAFRAGVQDYLTKPVDGVALAECLARLLADRWPADPVGRAQRYIREQLAKPMDLGALAGAVGLSEIHLRRLFQQQCGITPRRYLLKVRLECAGELLRTTVHAVEWIAGEVGFRSGTRFAKVFRRVYGHSPSEYRALHNRQCRSSLPEMIKTDRRLIEKD
ncbi:MAG: helix-turn-helix domain-containing protein [Candidatus Methylomirabilota bacterium]